MRATLVFLVSLFACAGSASAQADCGFPFWGAVYWSPGGPGPSDPILYQVNLYTTTIAPFDAHTRIFSRPTIGPANPSLSSTPIAIDVIIGTDAMTMPGYQLAGQLDRYHGTLGVLPVGEYDVSATIRRVDPSSGALDPVCPGYGGGFLIHFVSAMAAATGTAPVIEYYDSHLGHYFLTQGASEIQALDGGMFPGWVRTGQSFLAYLPGQSDRRGDPIWRWYGLPSAGLDSHFFSGIDAPLSPAWQIESMDAFELAPPFSLNGDCRAGTIPVYRLWNNRPDNDHRYTTDPAIRAQLIASGYLSEGYGPNGVGMCAVAQ